MLVHAKAFKYIRWGTLVGWLADSVDVKHPEAEPISPGRNKLFNSHKQLSNSTPRRLGRSHSMAKGSWRFVSLRARTWWAKWGSPKAPPRSPALPRVGRQPPRRCWAIAGHRGGAAPRPQPSRRRPRQMLAGPQTPAPWAAFAAPETAAAAAGHLAPPRALVPRAV